jgi:DNA-binding CsgD family transcriptional regulator
MLGHFAYGQIQDLLKAANAAPGERQFRSPLTARERECLHWVSQGKTDFEIGVILGISARTARFHIENSKRKLGVTSRVQAVTAAMRAHAIAA